MLDTEKEREIEKERDTNKERKYECVCVCLWNKVTNCKKAAKGWSLVESKFRQINYSSERLLKP